MFERVGRMFWSNKTNEETTSSTTTKSNPLEMNTSNGSTENMYKMKVDNSSIILQRIKQLHQEHIMSDVTLVIDGKEHPAHRLLLCASSDVFQVMLMRPEWSEWHESRVILQEPPQCSAVFHEFLEYFYTGQIVLCHENVMPILALADKYNVKKLARMCILYMCNNIAHAASHNQLISWLQYTLACGHGEVSKNCQNFLKWNLEMIAETDDFGNFDSELLISLLQQNDLVVANEMSLYHCAVRWLDLQIERMKNDGMTDSKVNEHIETLTTHVMMNIRFPMMTPRQLAELLLSPLVKRFKEFFVERMAIGMIYHSGQEDRVQDLCFTENGKLLFTPRLYTKDSCSSILTVDNFSSMTNYSTRTFVFTSHTSLAEYQGDCTCEWVIDMYPKGVWYKKFFLIVWQGKLEIPEFIIPTVRLSIINKDTANIRAKVGILIYGISAGIEHIIHVVERIYTFSEDERLLNLDNVIPFDEINPQVTAENLSTSPSCFLIGSNRDMLKMHIIITPVTEVCSNISPNLIFK